MNALKVDAEWCPRDGYSLSNEEDSKRVAFVGSRVWRNPQFELIESPTPALGEHEVLIQVKVCGICGSDTHLYETDPEGYIVFSGKTKLPCIMGHEFSGVVVDAGNSVRTLRRGDPVVVESVLWCGMCLPCRSGAPNQCENIKLLGLCVDGAFADFVAVDEKHCWKIDSFRKIYSEQESFDIGALVEPTGCAYNGMYISGGGFKPGGVVGVFGLGPIGLAAVALARATGASEVVAFDVVDERVEIAKRMGADHAFTIRPFKDKSPSKIIMELTDGGGADMLVEAAGAAHQTVPEMERSLAPRGKLVYLGRAATQTPILWDNLVSGASCIVGARGHAGYGIFHHIIKLIAAGRLDLRPIITSRYSLTNIMDGFKKSSLRTDGKILIDVTNGVADPVPAR